MSRRGNCHDNAVAESFFQLLKRERIKKKIYGTREEARSDIFDYIEMFYNSKRRHGSSDQMSPTEYENQYYQRLGSMSRVVLRSGYKDVLIKYTFLFCNVQIILLKIVF